MSYAYATALTSPSTALSGPAVSPECKAAGEAFAKVAQWAGLEPGLIAKTIGECCQSFEHASGSTGDKAKAMAKCFAKAGALAAGAAACTATGAGAVVAGLCASVAAAIMGRLLTYDTTQVVVGVLAAAVCGLVTGGVAAPVCFFAAAELTAWLSDNVGPVLESIFHPSAAANREKARRKAEHELYFKTVDSVQKTQAVINEQWSASVNRIWELFDAAFPANYRAQAKTSLGFGGDYHSISLTLLNAGVPYTIYPFTNAAGVQHTVDTYPLCEALGKKVNGTYGPLAPICPVDIVDIFYKGTMGGKDTTQALKEVMPKIEKDVNAFFMVLPIVEAILASRITMLAISIKSQELLENAHKATRSQLGSRVILAATMAESAANSAKSGNAKERARYVLRAKQQYDIADAAYKKLMHDEYGGTPTSAKAAAMQQVACENDPVCFRVSKAIKRAAAAKKNAPIFAAQAARNRMLIGGALVAGVAGATYLAVRR